MNKKIIATSLLTGALLIGTISTGTVSASTSEQDNIKQDNQISPRVKWSGNAYLTTSAYSNVNSSNNFFNDRPVVTNSSGNKGSIKVMVMNARGQQVGSVKTIAKGKSARLDSIPWNSGTYTLRAKASSKNGTYLISID